MKRKEQCVDDWFVLVIGGGLQKEFQSKRFIDFFVELFVFIAVDAQLQGATQAVDASRLQ